MTAIELQLAIVAGFYAVTGAGLWYFMPLFQDIVDEYEQYQEWKVNVQ